MAAKMTAPHSPEIVKAQLQGKSEEQYIKEVKQIIIENIRDLFYKSNLSMRQFAVQVGISHSSLARILERNGENVRLDTICKIGANMGVPIQNLITKNDGHPMQTMKYIANFSGGKDSTASIILAHEHNESLDLIIFSEVMFDKNISGELPEHIDFIKNKAFPLFNSWGYETKILHADKTYMDNFFREPTRGKRFGSGLKVGFPMSMKCDINKSIKIKAIKDFYMTIEEDVTQYIGIAIDEPKRLARLNGTNKISLLEKYGYTERMAYDLCKKYDLLSPIYSFAPRGGCWFCPNASDNELRHLRDNHPELWEKLIELENEPNLIGNMWNTLKKTAIKKKAEQFFWEGQQMSIEDFLKSEEEDEQQ